MSVDRERIISACNKALRPELFRDYAPNGLQVEGRDSIGDILTAVSASQAAITKAIASGADALLVHHGIFWGKGETRLTGTLRERVAALLSAGVNLLAWHLPLDAHPTLGNNARLAQLLGITQHPQEKPTDLVVYGEFASPIDGEKLLERLHASLGEQACCYGESNRPIKTIGWCTGAGSDFLEEAAGRGVDAFLTGEASERHFHLAHELDIHLFTGGHHATERYGVQALGEFIAEAFGVNHSFFDQPNPL